MTEILKKSSENYYHLFSCGTRSDVLFKDVKEFVDGMNIVALAVHEVGVSVLAFCLMDNHFHFILHGSDESVERLAMKISQIYMVRRKNRSSIGTIEKIEWDAKRIPENEYLQNAIAYVIRNPHFLSQSVMVFDYPWSSGSLYFRGAISLDRECSSFVPIGNYSSREYRTILKT